MYINAVQENSRLSAKVLFNALFRGPNFDVLSVVQKPLEETKILNAEVSILQTVSFLVVK